MTVIKIPYADRTIHVDMSTANSRSVGFIDLVNLRMRQENLSYNQSWAECWADPKLAPLVEAMKTQGRNCS